MHPPSIYSFVTSRRFIPIVIIIIIISGIFFYGIDSLPAQQQATVAVVASPTPVAIGWKQYVNTNQIYVLQYPQIFTPVVSTDSIIASTFSFTVDGKQYYFREFPPGTGSVGVQGYGQTIDKTQVTNMVYGGQQYLRIVWYTNNKPFLIAIRPNDPAKLSYSFQMDIPPVDSEKYLAMFDQVVSSLHFNQ